MGRLTARVLGSAAGGGFPQWNCRCPTCRLAWAGDVRVRAAHPGKPCRSPPTAKAGCLINASPDLPQQLRQSQGVASARRHARKPDQSGDRSPAPEIDQVAGLLSLREREPFAAVRHGRHACHARGERHVRRAGVGRSHVQGRRSRRSAHRCPADCRRELFTVPGKVPLYLESDNPETASETGSECRQSSCCAGETRIVLHVPGAAAVTPAMLARIAGRRSGLLRRHPISRRRNDHDRYRRQDRPPHGAHADRRRGWVSGRPRADCHCVGASMCTSTTPIRS